MFDGTGKPEPVLTDGQWAIISEGTQGGDGPDGPDGPDEFAITSGYLDG